MTWAIENEGWAARQAEVMDKTPRENRFSTQLARIACMNGCYYLVIFYSSDKYIFIVFIYVLLIFKALHRKSASLGKHHSTTQDGTSM